MTHEHLTEPEIISVDHEHHLINIRWHFYHYTVDHAAEKAQKVFLCYISKIEISQEYVKNGPTLLIMVARIEQAL